MKRYLAVSMALLCTIIVAANDIEREPIRYSQATPVNCISRLQSKLDSGEIVFRYDPEHGYLNELLRELKVPLSSQVLVYSKTSLQRNRITPKTPRAIYFNDDVYLGFCLHGTVMEVSVADPQLGTVFYTLDQDRESKPVFRRQTESCTICHASSHNYGLPGHLVRSVYPDSTGEPVLASGSYRTDQASPFSERWGGWYVTGTHGKQKHLGNQIFNRRRENEDSNQQSGQNVTELSKYFTTGLYPSQHSDLVALMVLEHQAVMHNRITRATLETKMALHYQEELNTALKEKAGTIFDSTRKRIDNLADELVKYMLMSGEAKLTETVKGTSTFAKEFSEMGIRDSKGRSLRDLELNTRLFRYPCSYLIYTECFDAIPEMVKQQIYQKLYHVLSGKDQSPVYAHLNKDDRQAILEILVDTKPTLPAFWRQRR